MIEIRVRGVEGAFSVFASEEDTGSAGAVFVDARLALGFVSGVPNSSAPSEGAILEETACVGRELEEDCGCSSYAGEISLTGAFFALLLFVVVPLPVRVVEDAFEARTFLDGVAERGAS